MSTVFAKLNLGAHREIVVLDAPSAFEPVLAALDDVAIERELRPGRPVRFAIAFVTTRARLDELSRALAAAAEGDVVLWMAYPKQSSKRHVCEFNRDDGWTVLGEAGFEAVRQVAIDEDWTALRFRRVEHIRTLARDPKRAVSAEGRQRAKAR